MPYKSICRLGVFYDGSFFSYSQSYFYHNLKKGWLSFQPFHELLEKCASDKEQGFSSYKVVYAAWHQGLFKSTAATHDQLKLDRNRHHDLMHAGIEAKYLPMSETEGEKGIDVAMAVDAMQIAIDDKIDIAAIVTGDGDFIPLVRSLMKQGIRVMAVYFEYDDGKNKSFINERLLRVCNYALNINALEQDHQYKKEYERLFYKHDKKK